MTMAWSYVLEMEKGLHVCKINSQEILWARSNQGCTNTNMVSGTNTGIHLLKSYVGNMNIRYRVRYGYGYLLWVRGPKLSI
jgi:hypothetical protein